MDTCRCGVAMMPRSAFTSMSRTERRAARAAGWDYHNAKGLCGNCYRRQWMGEHPTERAPRRPCRDSQGYTASEMLAEWRLVYDPELSKRQNCLQHAGRLGFKPSTLERRLERLGWTPPTASEGYRVAA